MYPGKRLASFCRLCLIKTQTRVAIFSQQEEEEANLLNLLKLIELDIDYEDEPEAVLCYDCIVTLEGFFQFKEQCHANDEFLKTLPPKDSAEDSEASEVDEPEEEEPDSAGCDYLQVDSEEEGRVESDGVFEELSPKRKVSKESPKKQTTSAAKRLKVHKCERPVLSQDPLDAVRQSGRVRKPTAKALASPMKKAFIKRPPPPVKPEPLVEKPKRKKSDHIKIREPTPNELQPLKDSYPDYFHFEKGPRSLYFTLVYYGERFNSAIYGGAQTYWQCAYKRKFRCPAVVHVSNDYTKFERRFEHTHGDQREQLSELELFTPRQALPAVFRICWQKLMEKKVRQQEVLKVKQELRLKGQPEEEVEEEEEELEQDDGAVDEDEEVQDGGAYALLKMLESDPEDEED